MVLPEPVGPVTRKMPLGRLDDVLEAAVVVLGEAQVLDAHLDTAAVEDAHDARTGRGWSAGC